MLLAKGVGTRVDGEWKHEYDTTHADQNKAPKGYLIQMCPKKRKREQSQRKMGMLVRVDL